MNSTNFYTLEQGKNKGSDRSVWHASLASVSHDVKHEQGLYTSMQMVILCSR